MINVFQILFSLFALAALYKTYKRKKVQQISMREAWFWGIFWFAVLLVVLWPNSVQMVADTLGIGRGSDLVLYVAVALLFYLLFSLQISFQKLNRDITKLVQKDAVEEKK
ncbi:DUF2304 domain-containing protein [Candidatus Nomurabacteria bacterium]|nr:DUF2304 domain-containing protein [Candidatus Nomurabacteria bacterium]